jgi:hypothetical protein
MGEQQEERVLLRYVRAPNLPLWHGEAPNSVLEDLSVSRAKGGTVFEVTPIQWDAVVEAAGGWTPYVPPVEPEHTIAEEQADWLSSQEFRVSPEERIVIERYAMAKATAYYQARGWSVEDVSDRESYDLRCQRVSSAELRVEVKGTTSDGAAILLTRNEVAHARQYFPNVALFVVAGIQLVDTDTTGLAATGGTELVLHPWKIDDSHLTPISFSYSVTGA